MMVLLKDAPEDSDHGRPSQRGLRNEELRGKASPAGKSHIRKQS